MYMFYSFIDSFMSLFKKTKNRNKAENPYCSLGVQQQTMLLSSRVPSSSLPNRWSPKKRGPLQSVGSSSTPIAPPFLRAWIEEEKLLGKFRDSIT